ncbi:DUF2931 family protein [Psychromonas sp. Urea-02u-13]|uniref:DUF2931 family protein n=1 Tax=Psychromonas sp. Urea-02u-13 TaxID=2058326 RepID=UPI0012FF3094|nr:DUF2931 family protein [Psychromonas sp. Urea-02u-13]
MNNEPKFTWEAQKNGPKGFPVKIINAILLFKGEDRGLPVPTGPSDGKWGDGFANHPEIEYQLPDRLSISFYSYFENQVYTDVFDLPYDKMVKLFQWGVENPFKRLKFQLPQYSRFVVGVAPGGTVAVWIAGPGEQHEVLFAQAEKGETNLSSVFMVPFPSEEEAEAFRLKVLKGDVGEERYNKIQNEGLPYDTWARYRKPYQWVIESFDQVVLTDHFATLIDGTRSNIQFDYSKVNESAIPSYIDFYYGPKLYDVLLDDYETIAAFEELQAIEGLKPEDRLIHIEMMPRFPKKNSTVRLYNAKHSIELKKAIFSD